MFRSDFRREAWGGVFKILFYIESKGKSARESWHKYGITSSEKVIFMQSFTLFSVAFTLSTLCFQLFVHCCISTLYKC
jgi:hypothetical protein